MVFISINAVSAQDNVTTSDVVLDTSDADLIGSDLSYNASLKTLDDSPLENQTIIFSINGINYTKITNSDGFAFLDINLNNGIYQISTIYEDSSKHQLINNNTIYVCNSEGTLIKDNLSGSEIQKIIDNANSGDTLIFAGSSYDNVAIDVNKSLNIISIVKSVFNGNSNKPVIKVSSNNVKISDLVISGGSEGIFLDNVGNVEISYNNITNNHNGIYLKNSNNTNVSNNNLLNNYNGIYFDENVFGTQILSNYISKSKNDAVSFVKSGSSTNMAYNILERNENGIFVDMVGDEDLNIELNTIQRNDGNGIYFGKNYRKSDDESGVINIANNSIVYNKEFNILGRDSIYLKIDLKTNWIASDNSRFNGVCEKIKFQKYHLNVQQVNSNTLSLSVDGIKTDSMLRVSYNGGKNWQTVTLVDGKANIAISNADGNVVFDYYETNSEYQYQLENYVPPTPVVPTNPDTPVNPENPQENPNDSTGNGNSTGRQEQIEGNGTTSNPDSGSSQGQSQSGVDNSNNAIEEASSQSSESSSSQSASQTVSSDSDSQSASEQISDSKKSVAKSLNIDEEVVRIAGMGFILLIIIAVIVIYYRDDVKFMLNRKNGQ